MRGRLGDGGVVSAGEEGGEAGVGVEGGGEVGAQSWAVVAGLLADGGDIPTGSGVAAGGEELEGDDDVAVVERRGLQEGFEEGFVEGVGVAGAAFHAADGDLGNVVGEGGSKVAAEEVAHGGDGREGGAVVNQGDGGAGKGGGREGGANAVGEDGGDLGRAVLGGEVDEAGGLVDAGGGEFGSEGGDAFGHVVDQGTARAEEEGEEDGVGVGLGFEEGGEGRFEQAGGLVLQLIGGHAGGVEEGDGVDGAGKEGCELGGEAAKDEGAFRTEGTIVVKEGDGRGGGHGSNKARAGGGANVER